MLQPTRTRFILHDSSSYKSGLFWPRSLRKAVEGSVKRCGDSVGGRFLFSALRS